MYILARCIVRDFQLARGILTHLQCSTFYMTEVRELWGNKGQDTVVPKERGVS